MKPKLVLIEGLPGSGKTSTAKLLHDCLTEMNISASLYLEGDLNHPADYEGVAYLTPSEYEGLRLEAPNLQKVTIPFYNGFFISYRELQVTDSVLHVLSQHDVYELPFPLHEKLIQLKWTSFVNQLAHRENEVVVLECCFLQNPMTVSLIRDDLRFEQSKDYVLTLAGILAPLNPILIYLKQDDILTSFLKIKKERPAEWYEGICNYYTKRGYGKSKQLVGESGVIKVLEARQNAEYDILNDLNIHTYFLNITQCEMKQKLVGMIDEWFN